MVKKLKRTEIVTTYSRAVDCWACGEKLPAGSPVAVYETESGRKEYPHCYSNNRCRLSFHKRHRKAGR
nr:hypothetical protein [uncultured bacterium]